MKENEKIKPLKTEIKKNGFIYTLTQRNDQKAIYQQENHGYEVFKIKKSKPHPKAIEDLKNFDFVEVFPNDEDFGSRAWHYKSLVDAQKKYDSL